MKLWRYIFVLLTLSGIVLNAQNPSSAPYCNGGYSTGQCNQPGPSNTAGNFINDFINCVQTTGGNTNINNCNSGCNANPNNFALYCQHYLQVTPGQTITMSVQSGSTFAQGFAVFIDWNQDNVFTTPAEYVAGTNNVPAAGTFTTMTFVIPPTVANGTYRMRVRCAFATTGPNITPCGTHGFGETEDYVIYVGPIPPTAAVVGATATVNSPLCAGQTASFNVLVSSAGTYTYTWTGPNTYTNASPGFIFAGAQPSLSGVYTVVVNNGNCPATSTVSLKVVAYPGYSVVPSFTICQGGAVLATSTFTNAPFNQSNYSFTWSPSSGAGVFNPNGQNTTISPPLLPTAVSVAVIPYSITITPTALNCPITQTIGITINNPLTPTLTLPPPMCSTVGLVNLIGAPGGGTWTAPGNPGILTAQGVLNTAISPTAGPFGVAYSVAAGTCIVANGGTVQVVRFNTAALSSSVSLRCSQDPQVNLMAVVQNTNGNWSGPFVLNNQFNPFNLPSGPYTVAYSTTSTPIANVCPSSTNLVIQVFNPPTPTIVPILPKCNTSPTVVLQASPVGGIWSQNGGVSSTGIQNPALCGIGNNAVVYSAGLGTCVATSTANFHVSQFNSATLLGTVGHKCVTNPPVNLMSIVQNTFTGVWTGIGVGSGATAGSYSFSPAGLPTGVYTLTYQTSSWPIAGLCDASQTIAASVLNPPLPTIAQAGPFCSRDNTVQLSVSPANSGTWTSFMYINSTGVFNPAKTSVGANLVQYVTGTSTCSVQRTLNINVEAFVDAAILKRVGEQCNTSSPISLLPLTLSGVGTWSGTGVSGSNFNPNVAGAGLHVLSYNTSSSPSGLCPHKDTMSVRVYSLASPVIVNAGPFCNNAGAIKLQVNPVGGIFAGTNNGAVTPSGLFNPAFGVMGQNIINYSISAGPCIAFGQTSVEVLQFVSAGFSNSQPISFCQGQAPVNMTQYVFNPGGNWGGTGIVSGSSMFDPGKIDPGSSVMVTYRTSPPGNGLLCPDQSSVMVTVNPTPTLELKAEPLEGCAPLPVNLSIKPSGNLPGQATWYINQKGEPIQGQSISHVFTSPGSYSFVANYVTDKGCASQGQLSSPVVVKESPQVNFEFEPREVSIANPEVTLNNLSTPLGNNSYEWTIQGHPSQEYEVSPRVVLPGLGYFRVKLVATSFNGCRQEMTRIIEVKNDFNVYIPSSFTPNSDGLNDEFMPVFSPYGLDSKSYELSIYDRWGKQLYQGKDPGKGWNGSFNNNNQETLKQDVYVFVIKFKDLEGRVYNKQGAVTLIGR